jgi:hypothetical protein
MIKFDLDNAWYCFCKEVKWTLAIRWQVWTISVLDFNRVPHHAHTLIQEKILSVCQKGINEFQTVCIRIKAVEIIKLCNDIPC